MGRAPQHDGSSSVTKEKAAEPLRARRLRTSATSNVGLAAELLVSGAARGPFGRRSLFLARLERLFLELGGLVAKHVGLIEVLLRQARVLGDGRLHAEQQILVDET